MNQFLKENQERLEKLNYDPILIIGTNKNNKDEIYYGAAPQLTLIDLYNYFVSIANDLANKKHYTAEELKIFENILQK